MSQQGNLGGQLKSPLARMQPARDVQHSGFRPVGPLPVGAQRITVVDHHHDAELVCEQLGELRVEATEPQSALHEQ